MIFKNYKFVIKGYKSVTTGYTPKYYTPSHQKSQDFFYRHFAQIFFSRFVKNADKIFWVFLQKSIDNRSGLWSHSIRFKREHKRKEREITK